MAIYLKFGNTKGIPATEGHTGQIAVLLKTFAVHISREVTMDGDQPHAGEWSGTATITKIADRAITALLKEALAAGQALLVTMVPARDRAQEILSYKLSNCVLSDYDVSAHTGRPHRNLRIELFGHRWFSAVLAPRTRQPIRTPRFMTHLQSSQTHLTSTQKGEYPWQSI